MTSTTPAQTVSRQDTNVVPVMDADPNEAIISRMVAWRNLVDELYDYFEQAEAHQKSASKQYLKMTKSFNKPSNYAANFDPNGIMTAVNALQESSNKLSMDCSEYAKNMAQCVALVDQIKSDIKHHIKQVKNQSSKGNKHIDKLHAESVKHVEELGRCTATFGTSNAVDSKSDPFVVNRYIQHLLDKQVRSENDHVQALLKVQNDCATFERHIIQSIQNVFTTYYSQVIHEAENLKTAIGSVQSITSKIPLSLEWEAFQKREQSLVNPSAPQREVGSIRYANMDHDSVKPVISGFLARKGNYLKTYTRGYYVLTASQYLHEFRTDNPITDPEPVFSLFIPDCMIGGHSEKESGKNKFAISGKEASKSKLTFGSGKHDYVFRADSFEECQSWWEALKASCCGMSSEIGGEEIGDGQVSRQQTDVGEGKGGDEGVPVDEAARQPGVF